MQTNKTLETVIHKWNTNRRAQADRQAGNSKCAVKETSVIGYII